jgi:hypothetical protein
MVSEKKLQEAKDSYMRLKMIQGALDIASEDENIEERFGYLLGGAAGIIEEAAEILQELIDANDGLKFDLKAA